MISVPKGTRKSSKRVGRGAGSGTGCTAGRGTKGQKARSGGKLRPGFEGGQMPLYRRLPARGFSNALFKSDPAVVSLKQLETRFENGELISIAELQKKNIVRKKESYVKVLANGSVSKALHIDETVQLSQSAKEKILAAGGRVGAAQQASENLPQEAAPAIDQTEDQSGAQTTAVEEKTEESDES